MKPSEKHGKMIFTAIAVLMVLSMGFLIWSYMYLEKRAYQLEELALQRTQQLLHIRLDGLFQELEEDIRQEAEVIKMGDSLILVERWIPILNASWPVMAIRLADEFGNESALFRQDTTYVAMHTALGSRDGPSIMMRYDGSHRRPITGPWLSEEVYDPRERVWFSKALEFTRDEPTWSLRVVEDESVPVLQVSYLIRGSAIDMPFQVISFSVDLSRSSWMDSRSASLLRAGIVLMDDEGRSLGQLTARKNPQLSAANDSTVAKWRRKKTSAPFHVETQGAVYNCLVGSYPLNGQQLFTGLAVDLQPLGFWLLPERIGLAVMMTSIMILSILLSWAWLRKRRADEHIRSQLQRNRSQELKLAKALGEREVLNREVHHRVKNNLQVVSSLLNLQATRLDEGVVKNEFLRGKRRIDTIALVHHKLYGLADLRNVDLFRFFNDLVAAVADMYAPQSRTVSTDVDTQGTHADQDTAIELGIILCELIANSFQHAFPYATGGHVEIRVQPVEGDLHRLIVKDNGKGLPESGQAGQGRLGLEIVEALAEQLDGSFHVRTEGGVTFEVLFRMKHKPPVIPTVETDVSE